MLPLRSPPTLAGQLLLVAISLLLPLKPLLLLLALLLLLCRPLVHAHLLAPAGRKLCCTLLQRKLAPPGRLSPPLPLLLPLLRLLLGLLLLSVN